jgi:hypothetical protein
LILGKRREARGKRQWEKGFKNLEVWHGGKRQMGVILRCPYCGRKGDYDEPSGMITGQTVCYECGRVIDLRDMDFSDELEKSVENDDVT